MKPEERLPPEVRARVQRVLQREARRLYDEGWRNCQVCSCLARLDDQLGDGPVVHPDPEHSPCEQCTRRVQVQS